MAELNLIYLGHPSAYLDVKMHNVILIIFLIISFISFLHVLTLKPLCLLYI